MKRLTATAVLLAATWAAGPGHADPMRPLPPPAGAASTPVAGSSSTGAAAPRREPPAASAEKEIGRLVAIREDSRGRRQALIGERWVAEGDSIEQAQVRSIEPNSVELVAGRTRTLLHLLPPLVASTVPGPSTFAASDAPRARTGTASTVTSTAPSAAPAGPLPARTPRAPMRRSPSPNMHPPEGPSP